MLTLWLFVSLVNVYLPLTFWCPAGPNRSLKLNVIEGSEVVRQQLKSILPPLLLFMNGKSPN